MPPYNVATVYPLTSKSSCF